ncbi:hypothetical protein Slin15195_G055740 [Septoria linicola]|uniref:N-acetylglucosamine-induced protein 1 n=1 Tax=Septoria linicola TaxID=215465 RepID=A0A9Q9ATH3_9PEZI|nr:hypothetical protein Slin14017_G071610 [Septoria linicola]USW52255.1 hypothetical protein Slin15195_G055740 [Septoria linicola]
MGSTSEEVTADDIDLNDPPFPLTSIDREILATRDEDYHRITWEDLKQIIANNTLEDLKRLPSDLRKYLAWSHNIKRQYGGITPFVVQERLRWTPPIQLTTSPPTFAHHSETFFSDPRDYAVLLNDWAYGFTPNISHLLVWSKTPIETDKDRGDVTEESRKRIEEFVEKYFVRELGEGGKDRVLWFKNWVSLQSVRGVDHVHVLVKDADEDVVRRWTERRDL